MSQENKNKKIIIQGARVAFAHVSLSENFEQEKPELFQLLQQHINDANRLSSITTLIQTEAAQNSNTVTANNIDTKEDRTEKQEKQQVECKKPNVESTNETADEKLNRQIAESKLALELFEKTGTFHGGALGSFDID